MTGKFTIIVEKILAGNFFHENVDNFSRKLSKIVEIFSSGNFFPKKVDTISEKVLTFSEKVVRTFLG
jgi:hypothetical protein